MRSSLLQVPVRGRVAGSLALFLCLSLVPAGHALHPKKKKKQVDLSNPTASSRQPDKELYDKAMLALKKGKFDVARLDLQTLLNTYPDSEYQMRAKLTVGDTWYREGGTAAMAQAEQEYKDFITFFPNTPEAAEAQMKVGDIYFAQMDKPDRDAQNVIHAEQEYRQMIQQFPDSTLVPRAKQRLREVQEVLAQRQFEVGEFYTGRQNWSAAIARLQTVVDTYPLFSHSDQALISIGDAYAAQAQLAAPLKISPKAREELIRAYNDRAAAAWNTVVLHYAMSPHVEDAKDRLIALGRSVPEPTPEQMAESEAQEGSRVPVRIKDRFSLLIKHGPSTVESARVGEPTLSDPAPTLAPTVASETVANFNLALRGQPIPAVGSTVAAGGAPAQPGGAAAGSTQPGGITMGDVNEAGAAPASAAPGSNAIGVEIINPGTAPATAPAAGAADPGSLTATPPTGSAVGASPQPAPADATAPAANPMRVYGLAAPVGPTVAPVLPPVDRPAAAADQVNDVKSGGPAQVATGTTAAKPGKKNPKPAYNSGQESSSKHKRKKGLEKVNPL
ncbi:MAG TPA: outer membrane protein assembly factor BamD [Acidobacteriaceae bacterium]